MTDDRQLLDNFLKRTKAEDLNVNFVQIHREGKLTAEYARLQKKCRLPSWSLAKGFTSCGVGIALDEGLLSLDEKIVDFFPEVEKKDRTGNLEKITLRHLLTMTSGLETPLFFTGSEEWRNTEDFIQYFFDASFAYEPGTRWLYSNFCTYMVACALEKRAGMTLLEYMKPRFFDRIGFVHPSWDTCPKGHTAASNGLLLSIDDLSLYGDVIMHYGRFGGEQVVPEAYMREATSALVDNSVLRSDNNRTYAGFGYGYQFLKNPGDGFRSEGRYGQECIALPSKDVVVTAMSLNNNERRFATILFEEVVDGLLI